MALQSQHFEIHPSLIEKNDFFSPLVKILVLLVRISRHRNKKYERRLVLHLAVVRVSPGPHFDSVVVCSVQCFGGVDDPPVSVVPYSKRYLAVTVLNTLRSVQTGRWGSKGKKVNGEEEKEERTGWVFGGRHARSEEFSAILCHHKSSVDSITTAIPDCCCTELCNTELLSHRTCCTGLLLYQTATIPGLLQPRHRLCAQC